MHERQQALLQAAFRDLHGQRLHGFALLVTLGNRALAASIAARALADGALQADELRHPERAAAWLRGRVLRMMPGDPGRLTQETEPERRAALGALGVSDGAFTALAALRTRERAAFVAAVIERLDAHDVESIVGKRGSDLRRLVASARATYLTVGAATDEPVDRLPVGPESLAARIADEAARTLGGRVGGPT